MKQQYLLALIFIFIIHSIGFSQWEECNNGLYGGYINTLSINANDIYAGNWGGNVIYNDNDFTLKWSSFLDSADYVNLYLWDGASGDWTIIDSNIAEETEEYVWHVNVVTYGDRFRIKVQSVNEPDNFSMSQCYISIEEEPEIPVNNEIKEIPLENNDISVFPNPAFSYINVVWDKTIVKEISIISIEGLNLTTRKTDNLNNIKINVNELSQGVYLIKFITENNYIFTKKLIINR